MIRKLFIIALLVFSCPAVWAKNVDLAALPKRNTVQLTIYNSADITLVKETRFVTFNKGANTLQFSWANTLIDPTSIELRPLEHADKIEVTATVFPGQKPQNLIWHIDSSYIGQAKVEVSYFTSGITWKMDYIGTCNPDESAMNFRGFVRVYNNSGETYDDAEVRLIVGKINLVEKIADLARRYGRPTPAPGKADYKMLRAKVARESFSRAAKPQMDAQAPKQIIKEGISEYFMFTVQGSEDVPNAWSKRMRALDVDDVKFDIVHRIREHHYGAGATRFFIWTNDKDHKLGECPLPDGLVRVFRDNGRNGLAFLAEQKISYVPVKAKAEINLGRDRLVVYHKRRMGTRRYNFKFRYNNNHRYVTGWDEEQKWTDEIRNYRDKPLAVEIRKQFPNGDYDFKSEIGANVFDFQTVEVKLSLKPGARVEYPYILTVRHGANVGQRRVRIIK